MKPVIAAMLAFAVAAPALAQAPPSRPLDLKLHARDVPAPGSTAPGVYYGDVGGKPDAGGLAAAAPDDGIHLSGRISTSIGYAKGFGTGTSTALELGVSKQSTDGSGFELQFGVRQSDGFARRWPYRRER